MIKKLSGMLLAGAVLFWGQALPGVALPSLPQDASVEDLHGDADDPIESDRTFEPLGGGDIRGADSDTAAANKTKKKCKKIKNKKRRRKCLKKARAQKRVERTVEFEYTCPCTGYLQLGGAGDNLGGGPIATGADDVYLTGVAQDASGTAISVNVNQDTDGDGFNNAVGRFCGETDDPIEINPGLEMRIFIGDAVACRGSVALGGTVTFTLSNLPPEDAPE